MNLSTLRELFASGTILSSNPFLSFSQPAPLATPSPLLSSLTSPIYESLSHLLLVVNLFHTLVAMNWISTKRDIQKMIRWRRSFAALVEDKKSLPSPSQALLVSES